MTDEIGNLVVNLDANVKKLEAKLQKSQAKVRGLERNVNRSTARISKSFTNVGLVVGRLGGALAALGATAAFDRMLTKLDGIGKTADKLGLTTDALQELRSAANQSGVGVATFDVAMQRFGRRLSEARDGTGVAKDALAELGIELFDASGVARSSEAVLGDVADAMSRMRDQTDRNRLAMRLFDSEGVALVNMLRDGADGLEEMRARASGVIPEEAIRNAEALRTEIGLLGEWIEAKLIGPAAAAVSVINRLFGIRGSLGGLEAATAAFDAASEKVVSAERNLARVRSLENDPLARFGQPEYAVGEAEARVAAARAQLDGARREMEALRSAAVADDVVALDPITVTASKPKLGRGGGGSTARPSEDQTLERLIDETMRWAELEDQIALTGDALQDYRADADAMRLVGDDATQMNIAQAEKLIEVRRRVEELQDAQAEAAEATRLQAQAVEGLASGFTDAILQAQSFEGVLRNLGATLLRSELQTLITGEGSSFLSTAFGALLGRAGGGGVSPGQPYLVGERGPELMVPKTAGTVVPAGRTASMIGGGVNMSWNIDARGADSGAVARLEAVLARHVATFKPQAVAAVREAQRARML